MTGLFGEISPVATAPSTAQTPLALPRGVAVAEIQGDTIVYVAATLSNQITALRLLPNGQLEPFAAGAFTTPPIVDEVRTLRVVDVDGTQYMVVGRTDGVATLRIEANGALTAIDDIPDSVSVFLGGVVGPTAAIDVGGETFVYVPAPFENGISAFRIEADGDLVLVDNENDASSPLNALGNVNDVLAVNVGANPFLVAVSTSEDAVSTFWIAATGEVTPVGRIEDADDPSFPFDAPVRIVSATVGDFTYVFTTSLSDGAVTTLLMSPTGALSFASSIDATSEWPAPSGIEVLEINGTQFLAVTSTTVGNDALAVLAINEDGSLSAIDTIRTTATAELASPQNLSFVEIDSRPFVLVTNATGGSVSVFELGAAADALVGTSSGDAILGLAGNDTLMGSGGADTLAGGIGDDLLEGGPQGDHVFGGDGHDVLIGDGGNDSLRGEDGNDEINGSGGADTAVGGNGEDTILGGDGLDSLIGGDDDDRLNGGGAADTVFGGDGDDHLYGADGKDVLGGGDGEDTLFGAGSSDTLNGGAGDDRLIGGQGFDKYRTGSGADIVVVKQGDGRDKVLDFETGADRIDLSDFGLANFDAVNALASLFGAGIIIDFGGGDELIIENFALADFKAADVIL